MSVDYDTLTQILNMEKTKKEKNDLFNESKIGMLLVGDHVLVLYDANSIQFVNVSLWLCVIQILCKSTLPKHTTKFGYAELEQQAYVLGSFVCV